MAHAGWALGSKMPLARPQMNVSQVFRAKPSPVALNVSVSQHRFPPKTLVKFNRQRGLMRVGATADDDAAKDEGGDVAEPDLDAADAEAAEAAAGDLKEVEVEQKPGHKAKVKRRNMNKMKRYMQQFERIENETAEEIGPNGRLIPTTFSVTWTNKKDKERIQKGMFDWNPPAPDDPVWENSPVKPEDGVPCKLEIYLEGIDQYDVDEACFNLIDRARATGAKVPGPRSLPMEFQKWNHLRAPFHRKHAQAHYGGRLYRKEVRVYNPTQLTLTALSNAYIPLCVEVLPVHCYSAKDSWEAYLRVKKLQLPEMQIDWAKIPLENADKEPVMPKPGKFKHFSPGVWIQPGFEEGQIDKFLR